MTKFENPAERLLHIIEEGKKHAGGRVNKSVWMDLLNVPDDHEPILLSRIGKTMALIGEISEALTSLDDINPDRYLGWVPTISAAFSEQNLNGHWITFIGKINDHTINYLSNTADILGSQGFNKSFDINEIQNISESIAEIITEIKSSDLPENVKVYMVSKLREILLAIDEYQITGAGPIIQVVESVFGHMVLNQEFRDCSKENPAASKFWDVMGKIVLVTTFVIGGLQIPNEVKKYLPAPVKETVVVEETKVDQ